MDYFIKYKKYIIMSGILLIFLLSSIFIYYKYSDNNKKTNTTSIALKKEDNKIEEKEEKVEEILEQYYVDIKGAVLNPGVYRLASNSIVNDVINIAGGLDENADTSCVNLSKAIENEMVIYIYTKTEANELKKEKETDDKSIICNTVKNEAFIDYNKDQTTNTVNDLNNKININTASITELTDLPNIGEQKAQAIISKREELGKFNSIEEIKEVSGIGEATFEKIKDLITI